MLQQSAQKGIPEGRVFELNKQRLAAVGSRALQDMLDRRDWSGLPQHSAFALMKGTKTSSGINKSIGAVYQGDRDSDSDNDDDEMDARRGMEAYYINNAYAGIEKEVEERGVDYASFRSMETKMLFQEEEEEEEVVKEVEVDVEDLDGGYAVFELNGQQEEDVEVEVEKEVEEEVELSVEEDEEGEFDSLLLDVDKWLSEN